MESASQRSLRGDTTLTCQPYAEAVRAYRDPVILSFGHEMNGNWYSWGYRHTSPGVFVAAWRHIVKMFRALGATNVTWLWTVNVIDDTQRGKIPDPDAMVARQQVRELGGDRWLLPQAVLAVRSIVRADHAAVQEAHDRDPILIAETGAVPAAGQAAKITNLFAGVRSYGLLGFVWFDATNSSGQKFSFSSRASMAAFRKGAKSYTRP